MSAAISPTSTSPGTGHAARTDRLTWGLAVANLVAQVGIIATGGAVRLTGSGLGCSQWPMCEPGSFTPEFQAETSLHSLIEFGNRTLTGVLGIIALALVWAVYRREPTASRPASLRRLVWLPLVGIAVQAVVGGITVWVDLHPAIVGSHMLISLALVAVSAYLLVRLRAGDAPPRPVVERRVRLVGAALAVVGVVLLVLGVITTGAGPHSGDADEPYRWALDPAFISRLHALAVWAFVALVLVGLALVRSVPAARRAWLVLLAVTALQGAIGYVQYFTGLPELLVGIHMVGSGLLVIALVYALASLVTREDEPAAAPTA
ncbi:COX15/CtaA family protein [Georgenia faecalis]|uniref:Heme A synthase n=1 Tax=Georgenia faecalis TaxID=2483799 RepID=A0ABV9DET9_9MICO|nr:COX15/CtaA family protein [Georgenia faecalis]